MIEYATKQELAILASFVIVITILLLLMIINLKNRIK